MFCRLLCLILLGAAPATAPAETPSGPARSPASTRPQDVLQPMLKVHWSRGPNLPQGLQDNDGGFIGDTLVYAGGFCSGREEDNQKKPGRYPRGFLNQTWGLDLAQTRPRWDRLPDFPGVARQGLFSAVVDNELYLYGGFSYDAPYTYADGWKLSSRNGRWEWTALPNLPWKLTSAGMVPIGSRLYLFGGADYDGKTGFFTHRDRDNHNPRLGAQLLMLDLASIERGWQRLPECPGTPRFVHAVQAANGKIFVIGGATGESPTRSVVDNWMFEPESRQWKRLRDLPVSSGNFPKSSNLIFADRYILLPGGHQYAEVEDPDGGVRPKYGSASVFNPSSGLHNDIFVYDIENNLFGSADKLPIDNNLPMSVVKDDRIFLLGGETGAGMVEGEFYGHHPDLLLVGRIELLPGARK